MPRGPLIRAHHIVGMIVLLRDCLQRTLLLTHHLHSRTAIVTVSRSLSVVPPTEQPEAVIPDPPTTCCMSGCANCVWIDYAKELAVIYKDGGEAAEKVMKTIEDPSLKIFLSLELKEAFKNNTSS